MSVEEVAAAIGRSLDRLATARAAIAEASQLVGEARDIYAACTAGTNDPEAEEAPARAAQVVEEIDSMYGRLALIDETLRGYLDSTGASLPGSAPTSAPTPTPDAAPPPTPAPKNNTGRASTCRPTPAGEARCG